VPRLSPPHDTKARHTPQRTTHTAVPPRSNPALPVPVAIEDGYTKPAYLDY